MLILEDLATLGEVQNFDEEKIKTMYAKRKGMDYRIARIAAFRKAYPNIPVGTGYHSRFVLVGDEFAQYFPNRNAMSNFSGPKKKYNTWLHQVRHFNTLMLLATQNVDHIDLRFRELTQFFIKVWGAFGDILMCAQPYIYVDEIEKAIDE